MLKKYLNDTSGNFAIMASLAGMTLLLSVAAAVDYTGLSKQSSQMQDYADAAVLAAAKSMEDDVAKLTKMARKSVISNNNTGKKINTQLVLKDDVLRVELKAKYPTSIFGIFGKPNLPVRVIAEAPVATSGPLNIALALDVTGSMTGANLTSLQSATNGLLDTMERLDNEKVRISIVPFAHYVNVGAHNKNAPWLDVPAEYSEQPPEKCITEKPVISKSGCTTTTTTHTYPPSSSSNDGVVTVTPGGSYDKTTETCTFYEYGPEETTCTMPPPIEYKFRGAVGSRKGTLNEVAAYGSDKIPGFLETTTISNLAKTELLPLTKDFAKLRSKIDSLVAHGETYVPGGLIWGWRTLTVTEPFTEAAKNQGHDMQNALVLMTDGVNTRSVTAPTHDGYDGAATDKLSAKLCENIKADGIHVYTVAYNFPTGTGMKTTKMLRNCASSPSQFYKAKDADQLEKVFDKIAMSLYSTRIIK